MFDNKSIENLEIKLAILKKERQEDLEKVETEYNNEYSDFFDNLFGKENIGIKRYIRAHFEIDKVDNINESSEKILEKSIIKTIDTLKISDINKKTLFEKISNNTKNIDIINNNFQKISDIKKDKNYPILEDLFNKGNLSEKDLVDISINYKKTKDFLESINILNSEKIDLIKSNFNILNNSKTSDRISDFENDFKTEIKKSQTLQKYPKIINFIGKNYFKLRLKNKVESKKERLKRMFKLAFLRLYRLKNLGIDIDEILNKIDSIDDFESYISLLIKYFETLKQNPVLQKDYIVSDELDNIEDIKNEAENNKEKILFGESKIIKISSLLEKGEKYFSNKDLNKLLSKDVDVLGDEFVNREENVGIYYEADNSDLEDDEEDNKKDYSEINLEEYLEELKEKLFKLEEEKRNIFLNGEYDKLDEINNNLLELDIEIQKIIKLLKIEEN